MPCGGIYPLSEAKGTITEKLSPIQGGCWVCGMGGAHHFCDEWDTYIHARCVPIFLLGREGQCVIHHEHTIELNFELEKPGANITNETICKHADGTWYWINETFSEEFGPYPTKESCEFDLKRYAEWLNKPKEETNATSVTER